MDEYIKTVAAPFISTKKQSELLNRMKKFFAVKIDPDPVETMKEWNDYFERWFRTTGDESSWSVGERLEKYKLAKQTFITLYWLSFSYRNFSPVAQEPAH